MTDPDHNGQEVPKPIRQIRFWLDSENWRRYRVEIIIFLLSIIGFALFYLFIPEDWIKNQAQEALMFMRCTFTAQMDKPLQCPID